MKREEEIALAYLDQGRHKCSILIGHSGENAILKGIEMIDRVVGDSLYSAFFIASTPEQADSLMSSQSMDVALFVIGDTFTMDAVSQIAHQYPDLKIVIIAKDGRFALDAFRIHAFDYLISPVSIEDLKNTFSHLGLQQQEPLLSVKCFGTFEVFFNHRPVKFHRSKSKEMFAYMVSNCGASSNTGELCGALFEDSGSLENKRSYFRNIVVDLKKTFEDLGLESVLVFSHNSFAIAPDLFQCDYYDFLEDGSKHRERYPEGFMKQYSWAEGMMEHGLSI